MAKAIGGAQLVSAAQPAARTLRAVWILRVTLGTIITLSALVFILGTSWDIQWHTLIGRDRTLIPPHIMMLTGVALSGLAALVGVLVETVWARHSPVVVETSTGFAGIFRSSLGAYIAGYAALMAALAFSMDSYWHALYGIDVEVIAPFHVMFLLAMGLVALGAAYMQSSAATLATRNGDTGGARAASLGGLLALGVMMCIFMLLADFTGEMLTIFTAIVLLAFVSAWALFAAVRAVEWRWAATCVGVVYGLFALLMQVFVPPATDALVAIEHLSFRKADAPFSLMAFQWPLGAILAAILFDIIREVARRRNWSARRLIVVAVVLIGILSSPFFALAIWLRDEGGTISPLYLLLFLALSLLGIPGAYIGSRLGRNMGASMRVLER